MNPFIQKAAEYVENSAWDCKNTFPGQLACVNVKALDPEIAGDIMILAAKLMRACVDLDEALTAAIGPMDDRMHSEDYEADDVDDSVFDDDGVQRF